MPDRFDKAAEQWKPQIVALVAHLITTIADDYRASDDPSDETPGMQITIATDDALSAWTYQTGDNSFSGSCYGFPHWGVGAVYRDSEPGAVANELLADLGEQWASKPENLLKLRERFSVTFEIVTPESAEHGDADSRGYVAECVGLRDALSAADMMRACKPEADSSPISLKNPPRWFTAHYATNLQTGAEESRSLHIPEGITAASRMRLARYLGLK